MNKKILIAVIVGVLFGLVLLGVYRKPENQGNELRESPASNQGTLEAKTDDSGEVTTTVVPKNITPNAASWDFEIEMNTHAVELDTNFLESSVLVVDGATYKPTAWEGDPPGGHHREGILKFSATIPKPKSITLKINQIGGIEERSFLWRTSP